MTAKATGNYPPAAVTISASALIVYGLWGVVVHPLIVHSLPKSWVMGALLLAIGLGMFTGRWAARFWARFMLVAYLGVLGFAMVMTVFPSAGLRHVATVSARQGTFLYLCVWALAAFILWHLLNTSPAKAFFNITTTDPDKLASRSRYRAWALPLSIAAWVFMTIDREMMTSKGMWVFTLFIVGLLPCVYLALAIGLFIARIRLVRSNPGCANRGLMVHAVIAPVVTYFVILITFILRHDRKYNPDSRSPSLPALDHKLIK